MRKNVVLPTPRIFGSTWKFVTLKKYVIFSRAFGPAFAAEALEKCFFFFRYICCGYVRLVIRSGVWTFFVCNMLDNNHENGPMMYYTYYWRAENRIGERKKSHESRRWLFWIYYTHRRLANFFSTRVVTSRAHTFVRSLFPSARI